MQSYISFQKHLDSALIAKSTILWMRAFGLVVWFSLWVEGSPVGFSECLQFFQIYLWFWLSSCLFCHWLGTKKSTGLSFRLEYLISFLPPKEQEMRITVFTIWLVVLVFAVENQDRLAWSTKQLLWFLYLSHKFSSIRTNTKIVICDIAKSTVLILNWIRKEVVNCFHGPATPNYNNLSKQML